MANFERKTALWPTEVLNENKHLDEDATDKALGTLKAIIGATKDSGGDVYKMAIGMKKTYDKNKGFSKDQANWIWKTSKSMF